LNDPFAAIDVDDVGDGLKRKKRYSDRKNYKRNSKICVKKQIQVFGGEHKVFKNKKDRQIEDQHGDDKKPRRPPVFLVFVNKKPESPVSRKRDDKHEYEERFAPRIKCKTREQKEAVFRKPVSVSEDYIINKQDKR